MCRECPATRRDYVTCMVSTRQSTYVYYFIHIYLNRLTRFYYFTFCLFLVMFFVVNPRPTFARYVLDAFITASRLSTLASATTDLRRPEYPRCFVQLCRRIFSKNRRHSFYYILAIDFSQLTNMNDFARSLY